MNTEVSREVKRKIYFWTGIFTIITSLLILLSINSKYKIEREGTIVNKFNAGIEILSGL